MPKLKTKKAVRKRFKITKKGKVKRSKSSRRHLLTGMSRKRKRKLRHSGIVSHGESRMLKRLMPYG